MKTKMCIFNDRKIPMNLQIQDDSGDNNYNLIMPGRFAIVEVYIEAGSIPYLKMWETGQALLSSVNPTLI